MRAPSGYAPEIWSSSEGWERLAWAIPHVLNVLGPDLCERLAACLSDNSTKVPVLGLSWLPLIHSLPCSVLGGGPVWAGLANVPRIERFSYGETQTQTQQPCERSVYCLTNRSGHAMPGCTGPRGKGPGSFRRQREPEEGRDHSLYCGFLGKEWAR